MYIKVKVNVGANKEKIENKSLDRYIISVKEPRERNLANTRIREIIAQIYKVNLNSVRIISGHQGQSKILSINI